MSPTLARTACSMPRCPEIAVERGRCPGHRRTTSQRGYGETHEAARQQLALTLPAPCAYGCGTLLDTNDSWVAAHVVDGSPLAGWIASCLTCNERAKHQLMRPIETAIVVRAGDGRPTGNAKRDERRSDAPFA